MEITISSLIEKTDQLHALRKQRALRTMSEDAQQIFELLPLLLHYHHPKLPGYLNIDGVPQGICNFAPSHRHSVYLQQHFRCAPESSACEIFGLYSMGSTASISQTEFSDLDIWVCHPASFTAEKKSLLNDKCQLISQWAAHQDVEVNFFLVSDDQFKTNVVSALSEDNSGSAQHLLLLDEFYRTALPIAGKQLVWYAVPPDIDQTYDEFVEQQIAQGQFDSESWLDLGGFDKVPAEEYFGAALWQLYKGISSPYKAVLKILLMEAYAADYPNPNLLAYETKRLLLDYEPEDIRLDAYYLMLAKVTDYLESIGDQQRLELVRACFYLKSCEAKPLPSSLAKARAMGWQQEFISELIEQWQWPKQKVEVLNQRSKWKTKLVKRSHNELLEALMQSYRNLIRFARKNDISESINPQDIAVLSRKLYAAFEVLPGKVEWINPKISPDLSEAHLSLVHSVNQPNIDPGWHLYNDKINSPSIFTKPSIMRSSNIVHLMAWCYFNKLLTPQTELEVFSRTNALSLEKLQQFSFDLRRAFAIDVPPASDLDLTRPCEIRQLSVFINLEQDPTVSWGGRVIEFDESSGDIFAFGRDVDCLLQSVDIVYRNSWNEIRTMSFSGNDAVVASLTTILGKMHRDAKLPEFIDVFGYSSHFNQKINDNFKSLLMDCIYARSQPRNQNIVKTVVLGIEKFGLFIDDRGVEVKKLEKSIDIYSQLSENKLKRKPVHYSKGTNLEIPNIVEAHASEGLIQYFFEDIADGFNIYIVDEKNNIEIYQEFEGSKDELVQGVNRFYTSSKEQYGSSDKSVNFNFPQFYNLISDKGNWLVLPFFHQQH